MYSLFSFCAYLFTCVSCMFVGFITQLCNGGECTENTTLPTPSCPQGYYGSNCTYRCSDRCTGSRCEASETGVGFCTEGCIQGYWGQSCRSECSPLCDGCNRLTGDCIACKPSANCEENCQELCPNSHCNCTETNQEPCLNGKFGSKCQWGCSEFCQGNICDRKFGVCISGCKKGYFGLKCGNKCNGNCRQGKCTIDGNCSEGCTPGFYGEFCELQCSEHCRLHTCGRHEGDCTSGCVDGFFGLRCNRTCPGCSLCDGRTGLCLGGDEGFITTEVAEVEDTKSGSQLILISTTASVSTILLVGFIILVLLYRAKVSSRQQYLTAVPPMTLPVSVNSTYNEAYDVINEQEVVLEHIFKSIPNNLNGSYTDERREEINFQTDRNSKRAIFRTL